MKSIKLIFLSVCLFTSTSYAKTIINFSKQLVVIYKVLNPLKVTVEPTEKMTVKRGTQKFKYSDSIDSRKKIEIKIEAPYNTRDEILDKIYGTATLQMQNNGIFDMVDITDKNKIIKGKGFFVNGGEGVSKQVLSLYNTSFKDKYEARTEIDAIFNEENKMMELGTYSGVLRIDVTYGE